MRASSRRCRDLEWRAAARATGTCSQLLILLLVTCSVRCTAGQLGEQWLAICVCSGYMFMARKSLPSGSHFVPCALCVHAFEACPPCFPSCCSYIPHRNGTGNGFLGAIQSLFNKASQPEQSAGSLPPAASSDFVPSLALSQGLTNIKVVPNGSSTPASGARWDKGWEQDGPLRPSESDSVLDRLKASAVDYYRYTKFILNLKLFLLTVMCLVSSLRASPCQQGRMRCACMQGSGKSHVRGGLRFSGQFKSLMAAVGVPYRMVSSAQQYPTASSALQ